MQQIRQNVFETNSSSSHSISIANNFDALDKNFPEEDGKIVIEPGEFGWEEEYYTSSYVKAQYCLTYVKQNKNQGDENMLLRVLEEVLQKPIELRQMTSDFYEWGYIDHQSSDVCAEAFENETKLKMFIFSSDSVLRTDNDNH